MLGVWLFLCPPQSLWHTDTVPLSHLSLCHADTLVPLSHWHTVHLSHLSLCHTDTLVPLSHLSLCHTDTLALSRWHICPSLTLTHSPSVTLVPLSHWHTRPSVTMTHSPSITLLHWHNHSWTVAKHLDKLQYLLYNILAHWQHADPFIQIKILVLRFTPRRARPPCLPQVFRRTWYIQ